MSSRVRPPFEEVRVLSFGQALAGNVCAMTLAELGAEVVKIEAPKRPDANRTRLQPDLNPVYEPSGVETSAFFGGIARSTRGLTLDMKSERGKEVFRSLARVADVVVENFGPGVMRSWGLGYEALAELNPRITVLSLSGFGKGGPKADYRAYGGNICAFLGLTHAAGIDYGVHHDYVAAAHGSVAILAALFQRDRTGEGTFIDLAQTEAGAAVMGPLYLDFLVNGRDAGPSGNRVPGALASGVVPCAGSDRWLAFEVNDEEEWRRLAGASGEPDLAVGDEEGLERAVAAWAQAQTPHQALLKLQQADIAAGVVQQEEDLYRDPQLRVRGSITEVTHPDLGRIEYPAPVHRLGVTPARVKSPAPRLGQDSAAILSEWIGLSATEIDALRLAEVI